jgi:ribosomal protein S18 acetylase RimI-like enzyme
MPPVHFLPSAADLAIRAYAPADFAAVAALWERCGLTRPWNDPADDIALCLGSGHGAVLVGESAGAIAASVMVGHDGHRGWVYYLAVDPARGRKGHGRRMMAAAEAWLIARGLPKLHLMVRAENDAVAAFYRKLGYSDGGTRVFERWLIQPKRPKPAPPRIETVITYLEMKAPPPPRPPRQPAHPVALLRLAKPSAAFYRYLYRAVGEPWFWYERRILPDAELEPLIRAEGVEISVLYADGEPAGFAEIDYRDKAASSESGVNLAYFGLVPHFIGHGLGGFLLGRVVEEAWRRGASRLWVHTCTLDHPRALALYQKAGFVPYKQETKVIDDPRALGLIPATVPLPQAARLVAPS